MDRLGYREPQRGRTGSTVASLVVAILLVGAMSALSGCRKAQERSAQGVVEKEVLPNIDPLQAATAAPPKAAAGEVAALFDAAPRDVGSLTAAQNAVLQKIQREPTSAKVTIVAVNAEALQRDAIDLKLTPELTFAIKGRRSGQTGETAFSWTGDADADKGKVRATLVVHGQDVTGTIHAGAELYSLKPLGGGLHALVRLDPSKFPPDHPPEFDKMMPAPTPPKRRDAPAPDTVSDVRDQVRALRILVAYTPAVATAVADVAGLIDLAVEETNQTYLNSDINLRAVLAKVHPVTYTEAGHSIDLQRFRGTSDGQMDEVHALRHQFGADVAVLLTDNPAFCGLASGIGVDEANAFATVHYSCATGYYSFAHEIGHLQGAHHNPENDPSPGFAHGYYYEPGHWRTVMSYQCPSGGCTRLPYWSNPRVQYSGVAMGTAATHDNARMLGQTAAVVTGFESEASFGAIGYAFAHKPQEAVYTPWSIYSYNSSGGSIRVQRTQTGLYKVTFEGLGGRGTFGGHAQVTKHGIQLNTACHPIGWESGAKDFVVNVWCYDTTKSGTPVDSNFVVLALWP